MNFFSQLCTRFQHLMGRAVRATSNERDCALSLARSPLKEKLKQEPLPPKIGKILVDFCDHYEAAIQKLPEEKKNRALFEQMVALILEQMHTPYSFPIFHRALRSPVDYYSLGIEFIRPFIDREKSLVFGQTALDAIQKQIAKRENVILLANHQTEPDPQIISLLLENRAPNLATDMVFIAGHRVVSDPMAIPMSLGRNLLCIFSKKHLSEEPQRREAQISHNQKTLKKLQELLDEGGYCIYVAPSGGRDRLNSEGEIEIAPFDPQSVELFWLLGKAAKSTTHFYPLTLETYALMPPPSGIERELGEERRIHYTPVCASFGEEIDMEHFPGSESMERKEKKVKRAQYIWQQVCHNRHLAPSKEKS